MMKISLVESSPFSIFSITDLFSASLLQSLSKEYPPNSLFNLEDTTNKKRFGDHTQTAFEDFVQDNHNYKLFYDRITSDEFVGRILNALSDTDELKFLMIGQSKISRKSPFEFVIRTKSRFARRFKLKIGYEFSLMQSGSHLAPHTDSASKLLSILVFLPSKSELDGNVYKEIGTQFWKARDNSSVFPNWNSTLLNEIELNKFYQTHECFLQLPFTETKHYGFCKSDVSWHSVQHIQEGLSRKTINITFWISESRHHKRQFSKSNSLDQIF
jgi:hypothetical protein